MPGEMRKAAALATDDVKSNTAMEIRGRMELIALSSGHRAAPSVAAGAFLCLVRYEDQVTWVAVDDRTSYEMRLRRIFYY